MRRRKNRDSGKLARLEEREKWTADDAMQRSVKAYERIGELERKLDTVRADLVKSEEQRALLVGENHQANERWDAARAEIARLEEEVCWWSGEGQEPCDEMKEWQALAQNHKRTPEQDRRLRELSTWAQDQIRLPFEKEAELVAARAEVERLKELLRDAERRR